MKKKIICILCILMLIIIPFSAKTEANVVKKDVVDSQDTSLSDDLYTLSEVHNVWIRFSDLVTADINASAPVLVTTFLAIPPDLENQIKIDDVEFYPPGEFGFTFDEWLNHFARYVRYVNPGMSSLATWSTKFRLSKITYNIDPDLVTDDIPEDIAESYLGDAEKYDIYHDLIEWAVVAAIGGETNQYRKAKAIHDYIIFMLDYALGDGWDSAPVVLERGNGSCSEFCFLFIAMCRRAGIPARYIAGTRYNKDKPIPFIDKYYHRWTQIYLSPYGWVPVDVTFDNTLTGDDPEARDDYFGMTDSRIVATTICGDDSSILKWGYNARDNSNGPLSNIDRAFNWFEYDRQSPEIPGRPSGLTRVRPGQTYRYFIETDDPQLEDVEYFIDWGDGSNSGWRGPYGSGWRISITHQFANYYMEYKSLVRVKARDSNGFESDWSDPLTVTVLKARQKSNMLYPHFLEQITLRFPTLSRLSKILN